MKRGNGMKLEPIYKKQERRVEEGYNTDVDVDENAVVLNKSKK